ncbi:uncharacterized protein BDZ99DRAFT_378097, partial [Mytilinidion resinicola]
SSTPNLKFIVEGRPDVIDVVEPKLPDSMRSQIYFAKHDFMEPQPTAADILKNVVTTLKPGARIAIMETLLPPLDATPKTLEKFSRYVRYRRCSPHPLMFDGLTSCDRLGDLEMTAFANAKERNTE